MSDKKYDCRTCSYATYRDKQTIFCTVCMRKILDEKNEKAREHHGNESENNESLK
jgi:hypothetical protein